MKINEYPYPKVGDYARGTYPGGRFIEGVITETFEASLGDDAFVIGPRLGAFYLEEIVVLSQPREE